MARASVVGNGFGAGESRVWIDARLFETTDGSNPVAAAERRLGIDRPLDELFKAAVGPRPRLAVDGVGRLFDEHTLGATAQTARAAVEAGWDVVVTCQGEEWERVASAFGANGLPLRAVRVGPLEDAELDAIAAAEPRVAGMLARADLRRVLAGPKYLDVVLHGVPASPAAVWNEPSSWAGEADVAEWCWRRLVEGAPPSAARSAAAKHLAAKQADAVRDSVAEDDVDAAHLQAVDVLLRDRVCRKVAERIVFDHDLLGDWARQRLLLGRSDDLVVFLKERNRTASPLWLRALRLWALDVLERRDDPATWLAAVRALLAAAEPAAADRVLEAVALSARSATLLARIWPMLAVDGELLRRLLNRFLYAAATPNPMVKRLLPTLATAVPGDEGNLETWAAADHRVPLPVYWMPILATLHRHRDVVAINAPSEAARIARLWLQHTSSDTALRREASELALASAWRVHTTLARRERSRGAHWSDGLSEWSLCHDAERDTYAAAITAAIVLPAEAAALALEVAGRRDATAVDAPEERGVKHDPPWPHGPSRRVSDRFRDVVIDIGSFITLAAAAPEIAAEVLLAVLIDPPTERHHPGMLGLSYDEDRELCIEHVHGWLPAFYTRGPFGAFLHIAPVVAVDAILKLVNFTTERWVERETRDVHKLRGDQGQPRPIAVTMARDLGSGTVHWHGDADVYTWHLGDARAPHPVTSALMALEKWLYGRIDANEDASEPLEQIIRGSTSVAFGGLLSAVARYDRIQIAGPLSFLLNVPEFLHWEARPRHDLTVSAMFGWGLTRRSEAHLVAMAQQWYGMPHRKQDLHTIAQFLFPNDPAFRERLSSPLLTLQQELHRTDLPTDRREAVAEYVKTFNINRWEVIQLPDGRQAWQQRLTEEEVRDNEAALQQANETMLAIEFPHRCRELLDRATPLDDVQLERLWTDLHLVAGLVDTSSVSAPCGVSEADGGTGSPHRWAFDGVMGGIAVLLIRHAAWLDADRTRRAWVLQLLRRVTRKLPPQDSMDAWHPDETNDDRWECFYAEIVVAFWCDKPASKFWRHQAASLTMGFHYSPVRRLFAAAYTRRGDLSGGFDALCHLLLRWAAIRWHVNLARNQWPINIDVSAEANSLTTAFINDRLGGAWPSCRVAADAPVELPGLPLPPPRFRRGLDVSLIAAAFSNILRALEANSANERDQWVTFWRDLIDWRLIPHLDEAGNSMPSAEDRAATRDSHASNDRTPYRSDDWILDRLADVVFQLRSDERPELLWRPVLDLVPRRHRWAEHFLTPFFLNGLRSDPPTARFGELWTSMVRYAESLPQWDVADDETWAHLLGFEHLLHPHWHAQHAPLLNAMLPGLSSFVRARLRWGGRMVELLGLLQRPAAASIRTELLLPLADAVESRPHLIDSDGTPAALASFIDLLLRHHNSIVRSQREVFDAVTRILRALAAVQEPLAYELQDRLRRE